MVRDGLSEEVDLRNEKSDGGKETERQSLLVILSWASTKALRPKWKESKDCKRGNRVISEVQVQGDEDGELEGATVKVRV